MRATMRIQSPECRASQAIGEARQATFACLLLVMRKELGGRHSNRVNVCEEHNAK